MTTKSKPAVDQSEPALEEALPPDDKGATDEEAIALAIQTLSNLASLKLKVQELRTQAHQVRSQVDVLFSDEAVSEDDLNALKEGFKVLKTFAQTNLRYRELRSQAEQARETLDRVL